MLNKAALLMLEKYDEVIEECNRALKLDPLFYRAKVRMARALLTIGNPVLALNKLAEVKIKEKQFKLILFFLF